MKTQIKKWGDSNVLVLSPDFMKFYMAKIGDWVDLDDAIIISDALMKLKIEQKDSGVKNE